MKYEIGEKIGFLKFKGHGKIIRVLSNNMYVVRDNDGFDLTLSSEEIIKFYASNYDSNLNYVDKEEDVKFAKKIHFTEKEDKSNSRKSRTKMWEIDLHIENILSEYRHLTNTEIMLKQMMEFKTFFNRAIANKIQKIVVIHGVGEGVLKNEIRTFLSRQDNIEFYDANYSDYGKGATEVYFYKNH